MNKFDIIKYKIQVIKYNLDDLDTLLTSVYSKYHLAAMSQLTIISSIFLPLTVITGWYGMNFKSMEAKNGILSITYGQRYVLLLSILSIFLLFLTFKLADIPDFSF